jgi:hypothetical protein
VGFLTTTAGFNSLSPSEQQQQQFDVGWHQLHSTAGCAFRICSKLFPRSSSHHAGRQQQQQQ